MAKGTGGRRTAGKNDSGARRRGHVDAWAVGGRQELPARHSLWKVSIAVFATALLAVLVWHLLSGADQDHPAGGNRAPATESERATIERLRRELETAQKDLASAKEHEKTAVNPDYSS